MSKRKKRKKPKSCKSHRATPKASASCGDGPPRPAVYVRFGQVPDDERSEVLGPARGIIKDTARSGKEEGVACFEARRQPDGSLLVLTQFGRLKQLRRLLVFLAKAGRPPLEVRGDVVGRGIGGEPLLRNCESEEIPLRTPVVLDPPEDKYFAYMMGWSRFRLLRAVEGLPEIALAVPGNLEDGAFTHGLLVRMGDPKGMHARPAALLFARLRRARPGTRIGFDLGGRLFDLGEASRVRVGAILGLLVQSQEEVLALTSGLDAEQLLWAVAEAVAFRPGDHTSDWQQIGALVGGQQESRALMGEIHNGYAEILRDCG